MHPPTWPYRRPPPSPPPPSPRTSTRALHPRARARAHAHTHIRICMHRSHVRRFTTHACRDRAGSPISVHSTARAAIHTAFWSALPPPTTCAALWRLAELQWQVSLVISIARAVICVARIRTISYPYPRYSYPLFALFVPVSALFVPLSALFVPSSAVLVPLSGYPDKGTITADKGTKNAHKSARVHWASVLADVRCAPDWLRVPYRPRGAWSMRRAPSSGHSP